MSFKILDITGADSGDLWESHKNIVVTENVDNTNAMPAFEQKLTAYLKQPCVPQSTNIYDYWNCSHFPQIEIAARKHLSAQ